MTPCQGSDMQGNQVTPQPPVPPKGPGKNSFLKTMMEPALRAQEHKGLDSKYYYYPLSGNRTVSYKLAFATDNAAIKIIALIT